MKVKHEEEWRGKAGREKMLKGEEKKNSGCFYRYLGFIFGVGFAVISIYYDLLEWWINLLIGSGVFILFYIIGWFAVTDAQIDIERGKDEEWIEKGGKRRKGKYGEFER